MIAHNEKVTKCEKNKCSRKESKKKKKHRKEGKDIYNSLHKNTILFHFPWKPSAQLRITSKSLPPQRLVTDSKEDDNR